MTQNGKVCTSCTLLTLGTLVLCLDILNVLLKTPNEGHDTEMAKPKHFTGRLHSQNAVVQFVIVEPW